MQDYLMTLLGGFAHPSSSPCSVLLLQGVLMAAGTTGLLSACPVATQLAATWCWSLPVRRCSSRSSYLLRAWPV